MANENTALLGPCDLCAENRISNTAVADVRLPGGMWANVCEAHRYRVEGPRKPPEELPCCEECGAPEGTETPGCLLCGGQDLEILEELDRHIFEAAHAPGVL